MSVRKLIPGWKPDAPDIRDRIFRRRAAAAAQTFDLRTSTCMPAIYDQGQLGSCTANGWARCFQFDQRKLKYPDFMPSRLQIYYNERVIEGTVTVDAGAMIRSGAKALAKLGTSDETIWPYIINKFATAPSNDAITDARKHRAVRYWRVDNTRPANILSALSHGFPVVFGVSLYDSFISNTVFNTGKIPMPRTREQPIGGHCMVIVGATKTSWIVANSWGTEWGDGGYCYMPINYLTNNNLADDFWVLETVTK